MAPNGKTAPNDGGGDSDDLCGQTRLGNRPGEASSTEPALHTGSWRMPGGMCNVTGDASGAQRVAAPFTFEEYEVVIGSAERVTSNFDPPRRDEIPHVDLTRDVNDDDRDDLVVPDVDGFRVFIQMEDGAFADPVKIGPPTEMARIYGADGYRFDAWSQSRVHEMDENRGGRADSGWTGTTSIAMVRST